MTIATVTSEMSHVFVLSLAAFLLAMVLTPVYTFFAYRYRFWKRQREFPDAAPLFLGCVSAPGQFRELHLRRRAIRVILQRHPEASLRHRGVPRTQSRVNGSCTVTGELV